MLDIELPEDVEPLLKVDELDCVFASDVDGAFDEGDSCETAADLVDLIYERLAMRTEMRLQTTYPVYESPVECFL